MFSDTKMNQGSLCGKQLKLKHFSSSEVGFFEGPEKLLEIWFDLKCADGHCGLRRIPRCCFECNTSIKQKNKLWRNCSHYLVIGGTPFNLCHQKKCSTDKPFQTPFVCFRCELEKILDIAQCKIISSCHNVYMDAYLLSESTLLVSKHRFILKTCGNTTLLSAIPPLISLVNEYYPGAEVMNLYYSHRSFQEPLLQPQPHSNFELEVSYLMKIFEGGASLTFGGGDDAWYLYGLEKQKLESHDQTLEILMNDLNPDFMALFSTSAFSSSDELIKTIGLNDLMPKATIDAKIFEPCGFSLNAIDEDVYYTIHVTPQVECSWVSFETNVEMKRCLPLITKVLSLFHPRKAALSLMTNENIHSCDVKSVVETSNDYVMVNSQSSSMSAYHVIYLEVHSKEDLVILDGSDESCLAKATSWTKTMSKQLQAWMSNKFSYN